VLAYLPKNGVEAQAALEAGFDQILTDHLPHS